MHVVSQIVVGFQTTTVNLDLSNLNPLVQMGH